MKPDMNGKYVLITGATSGIGKETAKGLALMDANLILVARNEEKAKKTVTELKKINSSIEIDYFLADLSSMEQTRTFAENVKKKYQKLDVLINNAGLVIGERKTTAEGYEYTFALDHLSPFLLTGLLLDLLKKGTHSRIITVSSQAHKMGKIEFGDLMLQESYSPFKAYSQAKLANALFGYELARRLNGLNITSNTLHPGTVNSNFGSDLSGFFRVLIYLFKPFMISPKKGAETSVYLASSHDVEGITGKYFIKKKPAQTSRLSYNIETARRLWEESEKLTGFRYDFSGIQVKAASVPHEYNS